MAVELDEHGELRVIARSLAFLCLHHAELRAQTLVEQAEFLGRLGLARADVAAVLGSSEASLNEMVRQRRGRATKATPKKAVSKKVAPKNVVAKKASDARRR